MNIDIDKILTSVDQAMGVSRRLTTTAKVSSDTEK
jgi:hypothetical protein